MNPPIITSRTATEMTDATEAEETIKRTDTAEATTETKTEA